MSTGVPANTAIGSLNAISSTYLFVEIAVDAHTFLHGEEGVGVGLLNKIYQIFYLIFREAYTQNADAGAGTAPSAAGAACSTGGAT